MCKFIYVAGVPFSLSAHRHLTLLNALCAHAQLTQGCLIIFTIPCIRRQHDSMSHNHAGSGRLVDAYICRLHIR
jgi:hypothetical protein